jgi:hypothetical protein
VVQSGERKFCGGKELVTFLLRDEVVDDGKTNASDEVADVFIAGKIGHGEEVGFFGRSFCSVFAFVVGALLAVGTFVGSPSFGDCGVVLGIGLVNPWFGFGGWNDRQLI